MPDLAIRECPRCGASSEPGFFSKAALLHFVAPAEFRRLVVLGEDLNRRTLMGRLFPSRARFSPSYLCRACEIYVVDYGTVLSRKEADEAARSLTATPPK